MKQMLCIIITYHTINLNKYASAYEFAFYLLNRRDKKDKKNLFPLFIIVGYTMSEARDTNSKLQSQTLGYQSNHCQLITRVP